MRRDDRLNLAATFKTLGVSSMTPGVVARNPHPTQRMFFTTHIYCRFRSCLLRAPSICLTFLRVEARHENQWQ